jgi:hypothetical protein
MQPMKIEVASSDDIAALYVKYIELVDGGQETTLDVAFAPGVYGVASIGPIQLDLGGNPAPKDPRIDIVLRGVSADRPAVLHDLGMRVHARSLRLENLILTGRNQGLLDARVARSFEMARCVVANNVWGGPWGGALMRVSGVYGQPAYAVEIGDTWFVRNGQQSEAALLAVSPATGSFVDRVELRRVTFLDNGTHGDLQVHEARAIRADDVLAVKDHGGGAAVLRYARAEQVVVERSTFVVDDPAAIAFEDTRAWRSGMELTRSKIYVTGSSRALPGGVRGHAELLDGSRLRPRGAALDEVIAAITRSIPDPAIARARLRDALGLD